MRARSLLYGGGVGCKRAAAAVGVLAFAEACAPGPLDAVGLAPSTLADGLLAHYTFDEGTGTALSDHSGNAHSGVLTGGTWIADGRFGGALHFGGADFVTISNFPSAPSNFSVSLWVRAADAPMNQYETLLSTELAFQGGWELNLDKVSAGIGIHSAYWDRSANAYTYYECLCVPNESWTHVVSVVSTDDKTLSVYVDGTLESVSPAPSLISPGSPTLYLGRWSDVNRLLVGDIDDVAIYSRALVSAEVTELGLHPPPDPN